MLNNLGHSRLFNHIPFEDQFQLGLPGLASITQQSKVNKRTFFKSSGVFENISLRYLEIAVGNPSIDK